MENKAENVLNGLKWMKVLNEQSTSVHVLNELNMLKFECFENVEVYQMI